MTLLKLRLDFWLPFYRSFSTFSNISGGLCTQFFYSSAWWLEVIDVVNQKSYIQPQPKHKTSNFQNLIRKRLLRDIHSNQKQIKISNRLIINTITTLLNSLFVFFPIQQQPWHSNMMSDKGLNLFDECAAECVHLCLQE